MTSYRKEHLITLPATFIFETLNASVARVYRRFRVKPALEIWRERARELTAHANFLKAQEEYIRMIQRSWRRRKGEQAARGLRKFALEVRDKAARTIQGNVRIFLAQRRMQMQKLIIKEMNRNKVRVPSNRT